MGARIVLLQFGERTGRSDCPLHRRAERGAGRRFPSRRFSPSTSIPLRRVLHTMAQLTPGISYKQLKRVSDWQLTEEAQRQAPAELVGAISRLDATLHWGRTPPLFLTASYITRAIWSWRSTTPIPTATRKSTSRPSPCWVGASVRARNSHVVRPSNHLLLSTPSRNVLSLAK